MTQTLWEKKPKRMRVTVHGRAIAGVGAKDIALALIAEIGADGAQGHAIEFAGSAIAALSMEGRMTLQHVHRGRRTLRHGRARRDDLRLI